MKTLTGALAAAAVLAAAGSSHAATVYWNAWDPNSIVTSPTAGAASGTTGIVGVTYRGEVESLQQNYPSWGPSTTFSGGSVGNAPLQSDGIIQLFGATGSTNVITFSQAVIDPVVAIWSLGQAGGPASFVFDSPFTIEAGGPSAEYGGGSISGPPPVVTGQEANGVIQFHGTFNSISFTNPQAENWYGFAVGVDGLSGAPEPASWGLMILGFGGAGAALRRRRRSAAAVA